MLQYAKLKSYIYSDTKEKAVSILIINAYIGKNKDINNGISIKEL